VCALGSVEVMHHTRKLGFVISGKADVDICPFQETTNLQGSKPFASYLAFNCYIKPYLSLAYINAIKGSQILCFRNELIDYMFSERETSLGNWFTGIIIFKTTRSSSHQTQYPTSKTSTKIYGKGLPPASLSTRYAVSTTQAIFGTSQSFSNATTTNPT